MVPNDDKTAHAPETGGPGEPVIRVTGLRTQFGPNIVHDQLDLSVRRGEVIGIVGGSGTGKSVLLRTIIGLNPHTAGRIEILGQDMDTADSEATHYIQSRTGVLFQDGALFSSLTVAENVEVPLAEHAGMPAALQREIALVKIAMVGLPQDACNKYPSAACASAPVSRARSRSTPISCFSTNPPPASTRSALMNSTR
jgi:phospholipid/cholesterol/gamma-HCH transport system ATP-binding protein